MADLTIQGRNNLGYVPGTQVLAQKSLENVLHPEHMEKDSRELLDAGYDEIQHSPGASDGEKALAELGRAFKSSIKDRYPASMAMLSLMAHLAAAPVASSPVGAVVGKECASIALEVSRYFDGKPAAAEIYGTGFNIIASNPLASAQEKTLASFGVEVAKTPLSLKDRYLACNEVMSALAHSPLLLSGAHISDLALRSAMKVENSEDARHILDAGFATLLGASESTPREKAFALFGSEFARLSPDSYVAAAGKMITMDTIAACLPGTTGAVISTMAMKIIDCALVESDESPLFNTQETTVEKEMLDNAFALIRESPDSTDSEKKLADEGLAIHDDSGTMKESSLAAQKFLVLKHISELNGAPSLQEKKGADNELIVDEDTMEIDGFKIDCRKG
jgi:hypothetical protein